MCGEDGAQREVYKLKEEHEEGRVVLVTKEKRSLDRLKALNGLEGKSLREIPQLT